MGVFTLVCPAAMCSVALTAMPIWTPLETTSPRCCVLIRTMNHFKTWLFNWVEIFFYLWEGVIFLNTWKNFKKRFLPNIFPISASNFRKYSKGILANMGNLQFLFLPLKYNFFYCGTNLKKWLIKKNYFMFSTWQFSSPELLRSTFLQRKARCSSQTRLRFSVSSNNIHPFS